MTNDQGNPGQNPWPQQPSGQPQPYPQQQPYGQQYGAPSAGQRPPRSFREPLVGAIAVVVVAVVLTILNTVSTLTFGYGSEYIGQRLMYLVLPIAFAGLAFVGAAFVSPIDRAATRTAFLRSALIAGGLGAAALFLLTTVLTLVEGGDFLASFVSSGIVGTLSQSIEYIAVFIAAILLDRLGRNRTS
ncbi:hypothetical protein ELQ92_12575 [Labedella populi]|uniref:Uncharacterized protein n=1 Tax=Labedella populi TaxID=2498850 RepID=A0A3S4AGX0_9MICO|nr:hypothetical protein [Labedella populi]RWZ59652.1 hypothetical protein ELQ92_12575 [Labedella populi]